MQVKTRPFIAKLVPGEMFIISNMKTKSEPLGPSLNVNGYDTHLFHSIPTKVCVVTKVSQFGGVGQNMFSGNGSVIGTQEFDKYITAIEYVDGVTLIGFEDGRILKIYETGGTGDYMFNVHETDIGFEQHSGKWNNYLIGSHKFKKPINEIVNINDKTLICFDGGKILKVNGTGGSGYNLFAINETNDSFSGVSGYPYYVGYQKLDSSVSNITTSGNYTFIAFKDGRQIKLNGTGGSGQNMFAITKTNYGYSTVSGYDYLVGSQKFKSYINNGLVVGDVMLFSLKSKKLIKIFGTGGSGQNMFNLEEVNGEFETYSTGSFAYLIGDQVFEYWIVDMKFIEGFIYLVMSSGDILKILNVGGSGHHMFNLKYNTTTNEYQIQNNAYASYLFGAQDWSKVITTSAPSPSVQQIVQIDEFIFICYYTSGDDHNVSILKLMKMTNVATFDNFFGLVKIYGEKCYEANPAMSILDTSFIGCQTWYE